MFQSRRRSGVMVGGGGTVMPVNPNRPSFRPTPKKKPTFGAESETDATYGGPSAAASTSSKLSSSWRDASKGDGRTPSMHSSPGTSLTVRPARPKPGSALTVGAVGALASTKKSNAISVGSSQKRGNVLQSITQRMQQQDDTKKKEAQRAALEAAGGKKEKVMRMADFCTSYRVDPVLRAHMRPSSKLNRYKKGKKRSLANEVLPEGSRQKRNQQQAAPQVEIVDGQIVIRDSSLIVNEGVIDESQFEEVYEDQSLTATYHSYSNWNRTERWGVEETKRFYHVLGQCGTDFSMMTHYFPGRSRKTLRNKFKQEQRRQPSLVQRFLARSGELDLTPFDITWGESFSKGVKEKIEASKVQHETKKLNDSALTVKEEIVEKKKNSHMEDGTEQTQGISGCDNSMGNNQEDSTKEILDDSEPTERKINIRTDIAPVEVDKKADKIMQSCDEYRIIETVAEAEEEDLTLL